MTMDRFFLAFHVFGVLIWIGGLFALTAFIEAVAAEPDAPARGRLVKFLRQAAIVPDVGATIAIVFGTHWLFKFKLYQASYMHPKLSLVAVLIGLHGFLKVRARKVREGQAGAPPPVMKPVLSLVALGIIIFVITKLPS